MKISKLTRNAAIALSAIFLAGSVLPSFAQEDGRVHRHAKQKYDRQYEAPKGPASIYEPPFGGNG